MKIYKLDIDTSKPIRKVAQMQQNSEGVLSVYISNDGKYIRNLSCAMYEGGNEISAIAEGDDSFGYKFAVGEEPHIVKVTVKSTPIESPYTYIASSGSGHNMMQKFLIWIVLPAGIYHQDEFYNVADKFGSKKGFINIITVPATNLSSTNFERIYLTPWNTEQPAQFMDSQGQFLPADELISAASEISVGLNASVKRNAVLSTDTYPAVGYWTDYSLEHVIKPSTNAACFAEADIQEPTPEPDPEPTPEEDTEPTE